VAADLGKVLIIVGAFISLVGSLLWLGGDRIENLPIGRLPGDIFFQGDRVTFYFPLTTGILLSIAVSGLWWLVRLLSGR
jgi:hypothetical protein